MVSYLKSNLSLCFPSNDYGKTFLDVTDLINNTFIRTEFGIAIGPENSGKVSLGNMQDEIDSADTESYDTAIRLFIRVIMVFCQIQ